MMKFMARVNISSGDVNSDTDLTTESIFRQIIDERYTLKSNAQNDVIQDMCDLQARVEE